MVSVQIMPHIEYEVFLSRGLTTIGTGGLYRCRHRVKPPSEHGSTGAPCPSTVAGNSDYQHYDSNRREDGGQGRRQGCEKAKEGPSAPWTGGGKYARTTVI